MIGLVEKGWVKDSNGLSQKQTSTAMTEQTPPRALSNKCCASEQSTSSGNSRRHQETVIGAVIIGANFKRTASNCGRSADTHQCSSLEKCIPCARSFGEAVISMVRIRKVGSEPWCTGSAMTSVIMPVSLGSSKSLGHMSITTNWSACVEETVARRQSRRKGHAFLARTIFSAVFCGLLFCARHRRPLENERFEVCWPRCAFSNFFAFQLVKHLIPLSVPTVPVQQVARSLLIIIVFVVVVVLLLSLAEQKHANITMAADRDVIVAVFTNVLSWTVAKWFPNWVPNLLPNIEEADKTEVSGSSPVDNRTRCIAIGRPGGKEQLRLITLKSNHATCGYNTQEGSSFVDLSSIGDKASGLVVRIHSFSINYADCCIRW